MSEVTPGPWEADTDQEHHIVIHSPTYHNSIVVRDGEYLSIEDAALIVKAVNSHDRLVEALERCCDFIGEEMGSTNVLTPEPLARAALEEVADAGA